MQKQCPFSNAKVLFIKAYLWYAILKRLDYSLHDDLYFYIYCYLTKILRLHCMK